MMKAPRPIVIIVVMFALAIYTLSKGSSGTGAQAAGYLFGSIFFPALLAGAYVWWYRRRERGGS
jgi:Na+/proline symporter